MTPTVLVRGMTPDDITNVLEIQSYCYDVSKCESPTSFLAKLRTSPQSCFVAQVHDEPAGYLVAVPAAAGHPPPLNEATYTAPPEADALYLHDLAVHPQARGAGVAPALMDAYFRALGQLKARFACLTAVNASSAFWERHGFRVTAPAGAGAAHLATYGDGAQYMTLRA